MAELLLLYESDKLATNGLCNSQAKTLDAAEQAHDSRAHARPPKKSSASAMK